MNTGSGKAKDDNKNNSKISIWIIIPIVIGTFVIISGSLAAYSYRDKKQQQTLEMDTARLDKALKAQKILASNPQERLINVQERLEWAFNYFPTELAGSTVLMSILAVASYNNLEVISIQEKSPTRQIVEEGVYYAWPFSLRVEGGLNSILAFIANLEQERAGPLVLKKATLSVNKAVYSANLDIAFYTRSITEKAPSTQKSEKTIEKSNLK